MHFSHKGKYSTVLLAKMCWCCVSAHQLKPIVPSPVLAHPLNSLPFKSTDSACNTLSTYRKLNLFSLVRWPHAYNLLKVLKGVILSVDTDAFMEIINIWLFVQVQTHLKRLVITFDSAMRTLTITRIRKKYTHTLRVQPTQTTSSLSWSL